MLVFPKAAFLPRAAAFALDGIFILIVCGLFDLMEDSPGTFIFLMLAYHVAFWTWNGTTIGGIVCHLRVVRTTVTAALSRRARSRLASLFSIVASDSACCGSSRTRNGRRGTT